MKTEHFVMYCKTYRKDYQVAKKMLDSFQAYNRDGIQMFLSCPQEDYELFQELGDENIHIMRDEEFAGAYFLTQTETNFSLGYLNQEICKLSFWETGISENYLCVDSDTCFIRDFYYSDFMYSDTVPYTVLTMDKELKVEREYQEYWDLREKKLREIYEFYGMGHEVLKTCHGLQTLNADVLKTMKEFLLEKNMQYRDAIELSPFEFTWYNVAVQKFDVIPVIEIEPLFRYFHNRGEYDNARRENIRLEDWKRSYVGIVMNSNWNKKGIIYKDPSLYQRLSYRLRKVFRRVMG